MVILWLVFVVLFLVMPLRTYARAYRDRKIAEARLGITFCVNEMQEILLDGKITVGDVSHDFLALAMQRAQYATDFRIVRNPSKGLPKRSQQLYDQLEKELREEDCPFRPVLIEFLNHHAWAVFYSHPWKAFFFVLSFFWDYSVYRFKISQTKALITAVIMAGKIITRMKSGSRELRMQEIEVNMITSTEVVWAKTGQVTA